MERRRLNFEKKKSLKSVLFVSGVDPDRVVLNWFGLPAEKMDLYAASYHRAGRILADGYGHPRSHRDFDACPAVFLYRHSLELYLKAFLISGHKLLILRRRPFPDIDKLLSSHRLLDFLPGFENIVSELGWDWDMGVDGLRSKQQFQELLRELDRVDQQSFSFRYPMDKKGRPALPERFDFSMAAFASRMDSLLNVLGGAVTGVEAAFDSEAEMSLGDDG